MYCDYMMLIGIICSVVVDSTSNTIEMTPDQKKEQQEREQELHASSLRVPRRPPWNSKTTAEELDTNEKQSFLIWRRDLASLEFWAYEPLVVKSGLLYNTEPEMPIMSISFIHNLQAYELPFCLKFKMVIFIFQESVKMDKAQFEGCGMEGRRRYRGDYYNQEGSKVNRKSSGGDWQQTVLSWEKKFCTSICKVPWNKILDAKKYLHCHDNVVNWDDSGVKEAFDDANMRYYAETHGLPCETEISDPDKYIDEVDWDCRIDQDLLHDLVKKPVDVDTARKRENIEIFGDSFLQDQGFSSTGWGDGVEESKENPKKLHLM